MELFDRRHGGLLAAWHAEYAGGGSGKWRGETGEAFRGLLLATLWTHLAAPLGGLLLFAGIAGARTTAGRVACAAGGAIALGAFARMVQLGLFRAALEFPP